MVIVGKLRLSQIEHVKTEVTSPMSCYQVDAEVAGFQLSFSLMSVIRTGCCKGLDIVFKVIR